MGDLMNKDSNYLLISRKYFSRYVLAYEVILSSLCVKINQKTRLNAEEIQMVINSGLMDESYIILELQYEEDNKAYSLSSLNKIWFPDDELKQRFIDTSYENFNVESLNCGVVVCTSGEANDLVLDVEPPAIVSKSDFVNMMMLEDGIIAMFHNKLKECSRLDDLSLILKSNDSKNDLLRALIKLNSNDEIDISVRDHFIELCLDNGIDSGWDANQILGQLTSLLPAQITNNKTYLHWRSLAEAFVNSERVPGKLFTDPEDGSIVLRSIILVLLNPEFDQLKALKDQNIFEIGSQVYNTAQAFICLRSGYSLLNSGQRDEISEHRVWLQELNAALHNDSFHQDNNHSNTDCELTALSIDESELDGVSSISSFEFLTESNENIGGQKTFDIKGVYPNSGFKMSLLLNTESSQLSVWIVDLRSDAGAKKYKGKLALDLIQLQSNFELGVRFETDINGVYLRLASKVYEESDLKITLNQILTQTSLLKSLNSRKTTFI